MNRIFTSVIVIATLSCISSESRKKFSEDTYRYWPSYQYLEVENLDTIIAQTWIEKDSVISGWDWSLPSWIVPSPRSMVGLQRRVGLNTPFQPLNLKFKSNAVGVLWVKWRDLEPTIGNYNFEPLVDRIKQANSLGLEVVLRILGHSKLRGYDDLALSRGDAPLWLEDLGVNFLPKRDSIKYPRDNLNFDPAHPEFHKRYLMLVEELAKSGIPEMVIAAYVGYASPTNGDEGIGPYREQEMIANDTVQHVKERLDTWGKAFEGMEYKIYMGGTSHYGLKKGFGIRRGFVEMYMYRIPDSDLGQYIDEKGYLAVDEDAPILRYRCFNGDENEEYEEVWATKSREFRFGPNTDSYPYRYFTSTLRALQMRCTYILATGHLLPKMVPFMSLELGRTVEDTPDVWTFLRTSYIRGDYYKSQDDGAREITTEEMVEGITTKNFERWLFQRDSPGYETQPAIRIDHPIAMWMIQKDKYYDYIARSGKRIGFDIDDQWGHSKNQIAIKVTYFDNTSGDMILKFSGGKNMKSIKLKGDGNLKTATFYVSSMEPNSMDNNYDFILEASDNTESIIISMVRVVGARSNI
ncbi:MAG: hypothetical protein RIA69_05845 [Cyclobacteriaceae bacterium]